MKAKLADWLVLGAVIGLLTVVLSIFNYRLVIPEGEDFSWGGALVIVVGYAVVTLVAAYLIDFVTKSVLKKK